MENPNGKTNIVELLLLYNFDDMGLISGTTLVELQILGVGNSFFGPCDCNFTAFCGFVHIGVRSEY